MKLILKNNSSDDFTYATATVVVPSNGSLDVNSRLWFSLSNDIHFITDVRNHNVTVNDGIRDYEPAEAEIFVEDLVDKNISKDSDGSAMQRLKVTTAGWSLHYHGLEMTTSSLTGAVDRDQNNQEYGFASIKLYDGGGVLITNPELVNTCVKSVIDWEPTFDYDIIGGDVFLATTPEGDMRVSVVGVPDVPAIYGGSKVFMSGFNLKYASPTGIHLDGKTPKSTVYNPVMHTNKVRIIIHHDAGVSHTILVMFNIFKA